MTTPDRTPVRKQRRQLQRWVDFSPSFFLQSRFNTLRLLSHWRPEDALRGRRFAEDDEMKPNVREEHRLFSKDIYATVMQLLRQARKKGAGNEGNFVEKQFQISI